MRTLCRATLALTLVSCVGSGPAAAADDSPTSSLLSRLRGLEPHADPRTADPPDPDADPPQPDLDPLCEADELARLSVAGLNFAPDQRRYVMAPPRGGSFFISAIPCDPQVTVQARSVPVGRDTATRLWAGDGRPTDIVLYRGWREVGRYTLEIDPGLPPPAPGPGIAAVTSPGLRSIDDGRTVRHVVPSRRDDRIPLDITVVDRDVQIFVNGDPVPTGETVDAYGPPGSVLEVVAYRDWVEVGRWSIEVGDDAQINPQALDFSPSLYVSGGAGVARIRLANDTVDVMPLPVEGTSFLLAADDVNARLYATTSGPQDALVAFDLFDHAAVVHRSFPEDAELGAVTVAPGGLSVNVAYLLTGVMATYEAKDLVFSAVEYLWGIAMPMQLAYRPGTLDLFVTDFWATTIEGADTTHAVVRSPKVDWADGGFDFAWAPITLPASQTNFDGDSGAGVAFLPAQGLVMMVNSRGDELVAVDEDTRQPLATAATASMPFFMAADPDSDAELGRVFVSHLQSGNLGVYTVTTGPTGGVTLEQEKRFNPCDAGHVVKPVFGDDPDTVYVLCTDGVTVLDADTLTVERHIALGGGYETDMVWVSR